MIYNFEKLTEAVINAEAVMIGDTTTAQDGDNDSETINQDPKSESYLPFSHGQYSRDYLQRIGTAP
jgi:hypothetical protein